MHEIMSREARVCVGELSMECQGTCQAHVHARSELGHCAP